MIRYCTRFMKSNNVCQLLKTECSWHVCSNKLNPWVFNMHYLSNSLTTVAHEKSTGASEEHAISPSHPQVLAVADKVQELGFSKDDIKALLSSQPDLLNIPSTLWHGTVKTLYESGFEKEDVMTVLDKCPKVLYLKKKMLDKHLEMWLSLGFDEEFLVKILTTHPTFLLVNDSHVLKRVKQFQLYFESKKRAGLLLLLAPNTLEENQKVLLDKLNYLDELCTDESDIAASGVLAHSSFHIKARHEFLIRAGFYKRPQKNFRKKLSRNPKLPSIVNTSDQDFVSNSGLSMFEYEVFLEMYKQELEEDDSSYNAKSGGDDTDDDDGHP